MNPGIYDISNNEYHSSDGISRSGISLLKKSPLDYWYKYLSGKQEEKKDTKSMDFGSLVHTLVLEPHLFDKEFIIEEKHDGRTAIGKQGKIEFEEKAKGRIVVSKDMLDMATVMQHEVLNHPHAAAILNGASFEKSLYWNDDETGVLCKTRPDIWNHEIMVLCDLKTSNDPSRRGFASSALAYDYHIQAAMQIDSVFIHTGILIDIFTFIVLPKEPPYKPYIYILDDMAIEKGRREYKDGLKLLKRCIETNRWDEDRNHPIGLNFTEYQLSTNSFTELLEKY